MGSGEVGGGDNMEHPESLFLGEEEEEKTGNEVKALAVADSRGVKGESAQDVTEGDKQKGLGRGERIRFEMDIIWKCAVEIALNYFFVVVIEASRRALHKGGV